MTETVHITEVVGFISLQSGYTIVSHSMFTSAKESYTCHPLTAQHVSVTFN